jgi:hypothetical protein
MNMIKKSLLVLFINTGSFFSFAQKGQLTIDRVSQMPNLPQPFKIIDFKQLAKKFDSTIYDFNATGQNWPMIWMDSSGKNFPQPVAGLYTAVGDVRQGPNSNKGMFHEALASMGSVLGAKLVGIDKTNQSGLNYVSMLKNYFNKETGWNIMMNNTCPEVALAGGGYGRDWWYDVYPNVLFYAVYDLYPNEAGFDEIARSIADKFYHADSILNGNYNYSFFDYGQMKPMTNHICAQPDVAAGHAWVLYSAYKKFGDERYLNGAKTAMAALQSHPQNPTYEVLMPFGAYVAARLNAEHGTQFDLKKMLDWSFDGTPICREGWGVLVGNWNRFDISGIVGSTVDHGGYGFLMNTYDFALPIVPMVRYNQAYAKEVAKWLLNAANAARFFYPQHIPANHQTIPELASVTKEVIGYEGLIKQSSFDRFKDLKGPVAQGDGPLWVIGKNPETSQFSVYGSAHVGIFGSIIRPTNVKGILQADLLATDFYRDSAYPTHLYYNPYGTQKRVTLMVPASQKVDFYNTITGEFIAKNVTKSATLTLPPLEAAVVVTIPSGSIITYNGNKLLANGVVINFNSSSVNTNKI